MAVDPWHSYTNEAERANQDAFEKNTFGLFFTKIFIALKAKLHSWNIGYPSGLYYIMDPRTSVTS